MRHLATIALVIAVAIAPLALYQLIDGLTSDVGSIAKARVVMLAGVLAAIPPLTTHRIVAGAYYVAAALSFFVVISSAVSSYPTTALWGAPYQSEGLLVILAYMALMLAASATMADRVVWDIVTAALGISLVAVTAIGITDYYGSPILLSPGAQRLMGISPDTPLKMRHAYRVIASTLGNSNHLGTYGAMVFPFFTALFLRRASVVRAWLVVTALAAIKISHSTGGMVGGLTGCFVAVVGTYERRRA